MLQDNYTDDLLCDTPLQRARRALKVALKKAAHELYSQTAPQQYHFNFECEGNHQLAYSIQLLN